jgi:hypothetical protein
MYIIFVLLFFLSVPIFMFWVLFGLIMQLLHKPLKRFTPVFIIILGVMVDSFIIALKLSS